MGVRVKLKNIAILNPRPFEVEDRDSNGVFEGGSLARRVHVTRLVQGRRHHESSTSFVMVWARQVDNSNL